MFDICVIKIKRPRHFPFGSEHFQKESKAAAGGLIHIAPDALSVHIGIQAITRDLIPGVAKRSCCRNKNILGRALSGKDRAAWEKNCAQKCCWDNHPNFNSIPLWICGEPFGAHAGLAYDTLHSPNLCCAANLPSTKQRYLNEKSIIQIRYGNRGPFFD